MSFSNLALGTKLLKGDRKSTEKFNVQQRPDTDLTGIQISSQEKVMLIVDQESVFTVNHDWLVHCYGIKEDQSSLSPLDGSGKIRLSKGLTII